MNKHTPFILTPISDILKNSVGACRGIGDGIETYPLCDYIMQSIFLRMTGAQEQKMKCICWDLATNDFEYRYKRYTLNPLGECSTFKEKKTVYTDLVDHIPEFAFREYFNNNKKEDIFNNCINSIDKLFSNTNLIVWAKQDYISYNSIVSDIQYHCIMSYKSKNGHSIFSDDKNNANNKNISMIEMYDLLYRHRNKCAHNTLSYQQNLPTLGTLLDKNYKYNNHFLRFLLLILIDEIFINTYKLYLKEFALKM